MIVGLTGGIACGKSTVAHIFAQLGCKIIDADKVAREVVEPGQEGLHAVVQRFGRTILDENGELDRKALGSIVFSDEEARADLNQILHPLIRQRMEQKKKQALGEEPPLVMMDIPLLYESNLQHTVEKVIVVYIPEELQLRRLMERDQLTEEEAVKRIKAQMSIEEKKQRGDYVIDNSGPIEETAAQVKRLFFELARNST